MTSHTRRQTATEGTAAGALRGIHLDLKYHMPNKAYLNEWVKRLPGWGFNALLLEYEDCFPYERYPFLRRPDGFRPEELRAFLDLARGVGLQVIPMVPTYAHLEFALAHEELAHLREKPDIQAKICARKPDAVRFVRDLIDSVLEYHGPDRYIHLGADEVWHTEWCEACARRIQEVGPVKMWADHIVPLLESLLKRGKRPIIFDDIFWKDFTSIDKAGLPQGTVLHSWNYDTTSLAGGGNNSGFASGWGALQQVDVYRKAGYDSLAGPCCNFGQLVPRHEHCLKNTQVWARKMRSAGLLGMINTAWAVFHVPLQATNLHAAATGVLCRDPDADVGPVWQERWYEDEFGAPAKGVPEALEILGAKWEIPMPAYGRPFTPLVYGYMNMVLHFPGRHGDRKRLGPYPKDWNEIDFVSVYRKGIEEVRRNPDQESIRAALDEKLAAFPGAVASVKAMARGATRHADDAAMLAVLAELKYASLRVFAHVLRGDGDAVALKRELGALEQPVRKVLARAWEPAGRARMWRAWWEPMLAALDGMQAPVEQVLNGKDRCVRSSAC